MKIMNETIAFKLSKNMNPLPSIKKTSFRVRNPTMAKVLSILLAAACFMHATGKIFIFKANECNTVRTS